MISVNSSSGLRGFCQIRWRSNVSTKSLLLIMPSYPTRIRIVSCLLFSTLIKASLKLEQPERNSQALSFRHENKEWNTVFLIYNQFSWGQLRSPAYRASTTQRAWNLTQSLQTMMRSVPILLLSFSEPVKTDATWVGNLSGSSTFDFHAIMIMPLGLAPVGSYIINYNCMYIYINIYIYIYICTHIYMYTFTYT